MDELIKDFDKETHGYDIEYPVVGWLMEALRSYALWVARESLPQKMSETKSDYKWDIQEVEKAEAFNATLDEYLSAMEARINGMSMELIPMHKIVSRAVAESDLPRVLSDAKEMVGLCHGTRKAYAVAHSQVTLEDPLRFFVKSDGSVVVNPNITCHSATGYVAAEGCMSLPEAGLFEVPRWDVMEVEYRDAGWKKIHRKVRGVEAQIFHHEIDHMDGKYVSD